MNHHYHDITSRIEGDPLWYDEAAVPRYCEFAPRQNANIYAEEVALVMIVCQNCGRPFDVCFSLGLSQKLLNNWRPLSAQIMDRAIHYGDPPNAGCCASGPTMNSIPRKVLQYWRLNGDTLDFERDRVFEIEITPDWAKD